MKIPDSAGALSLQKHIRRYIMAILAFFNGIFLRMVGWFLALVMLITGARMPSSSETSFEATDPDNLRLNISVFADIHMMGFFWSQFSLPTQSFRQLAFSLNDIGRAAQPVDALVLLGDNTQNGQTLEYVWLYGLLRRYNRANETFVVMGNHDLALNRLNARTAIRRHNFFWRSYDGTRATESYYTRVINGYTFIALAADGCTTHGCACHEPLSPGQAERVISDAQLEWLAGTMANSPEGKPIFIWTHQNISWFTQGNELLEIIEQYDNVFVVNGHWHDIPMSLRTENGVHHIQSPTIHSHSSYERAGYGIQIEVYSDHVVLRERNFMRGEWTMNEIVVDLV